MLKALVIDSDNIFQNLLCRLLISNGVLVVGRSSDLGQIPFLLRSTRPDVVLIGVSSEDVGKIRELSKAKEIDSSVKLIMLSIFDNPEDIASEQDDLIDAYIAKGSAAKEILGTITKVTTGRSRSLIATVKNNSRARVTDLS